MHYPCFLPFIYKELCLKTGLKIVWAIFSENFLPLTLLLHCKRSLLTFQITEIAQHCMNISRYSVYSVDNLLKIPLTLSGY